MPWERIPISLREDCGIGGRLCLSSKKESRHLSEDVKDAFTGRYTQLTYSTLDKDHGRVEERIYTALRPQEVLDESQYVPWKNLSSLVQVERLVTFSDGTERRDKQYYLSSLPAEAGGEDRCLYPWPLEDRKQIALAS